MRNSKTGIDGTIDEPWVLTASSYILAILLRMLIIDLAFVRSDAQTAVTRNEITDSVSHAAPACSD